MIESGGMRQHFPLFEHSEEFSHHFRSHSNSGLDESTECLYNVLQPHNR